MNRNHCVHPTVIEAPPGGEMTELVRGEEEKLLERLAPLVCSQPVTFDMSRVERIDAAGIAALIKLYRLATEAGQRFMIARPTPHVEEILALVGLDQILSPGDSGETCVTSLRFEETAA